MNGLTEVERVGDTIRRSTGPWTPAVHALLGHLEAASFDAAPRVLGIDERGREVLTYAEGEEATWSDEELAAVGRLVRRYHDAAESFTPPPDARWQALLGTPAEHEVVCHNDLSPWNTVYRAGVPVTLLDWDLAAPAPRIWDLAWAVYRYVPLFDDESCRRIGIPVQPRAERTRIFCEAYGLEDRERLFETVCARIDALVASARAWGEAGLPGWKDVWRDTGGRQWLTGREYVAANAGEWARELRP